MVVLPHEFVMTKYDGYFWHTAEHTLYSIKSGCLKPIKKRKQWVNPYTRQVVPEGFAVSVGGVRRYLAVDDLMALQPKATTDLEIIKKL